ncbi:MAG: 23S rRNA (guanosine(2251)-2'-O)-methyltransferase RlmB [Crocinitomicaceae bacterium]|nr:23S rRNA (guanosine(2251)-2'-O)-methyltransferase RlmB [Crocinitomicaceae bacterium]
MEQEKDFIYGVRAVIEAIRSGKEITKILIQKGLEKDLLNELNEEIKGKNYQLQFVPYERLQRATTGNHQGVVAYISPVEYGNLEEVILKCFDEGKDPFILVLDRITDVRNFGGIARSAECFGADAIVIPGKDSVSITPDAIKTSAGALNSIPVCKVDQIADGVDIMQSLGLKVYSCTEKGMLKAEDVDFKVPCAIVLGSEKDGITPKVIKRSNAVFQIPMSGNIASLNVSVAAGIASYEVLRQRS